MHLRCAAMVRRFCGMEMIWQRNGLRRSRASSFATPVALAFACCCITRLSTHAADSDRSGLSAVCWWGYPLQDAGPAHVVASLYDLIVIDYSQNGSDANAYTRAQFRQIKKSDEIVLSYVSIGEAEDYRLYRSKRWKKQPPWFLGLENPEWPGNYRVRYWSGAWWSVALRPLLGQNVECRIGRGLSRYRRRILLLEAARISGTRMRGPHDAARQRVG